MNRRERVFAVLSGEQPDRVPVGFWMHFSPEAYYGDEAVKTHIRYFEETQTDICKIMNECTYPCEHNIQAAADWKRVKVYDHGADFIQRQADVIRQVVDQVPDAATVATIHGVVASASHTLLGIPRYDSIGRFAQLYHLRTSPEEVWDAYKKIAHTLCAITEESVKAGADGVYYAALGGERDGFTDEEHAKYIAPLDQMVIQAAYDAGAKFVILHMCKPKVKLERFKDYRCDVVNWGIQESGVSLLDGHKLFPDQVLLGGLNNQHGPLIEGSYEALEREIHQIIAEVGERRFILGSDCTLPQDLEYGRIAMAARACGSYRERGMEKLG
ncbi:uroporphyrinogen decarboxylase family protein [Enterocloster lavalensis]|uniref:uroporphyrinogen decarboxylase family protein n=1 Tax=Enterocloster lavalensis TaxID=460384 RepID=UPI000D19C4F4|nr:uroporphyrinogen decarboxylase family protein [Enterocloster lavalensis]PST34444.1 uroporphyrinogen III decarboxylase [Enterocloster lavalensis]